MANLGAYGTARDLARVRDASEEARQAAHDSAAVHDALRERLQGVMARAVRTVENPGLFAALRFADTEALAQLVATGFVKPARKVPPQASYRKRNAKNRHAATDPSVNRESISEFSREARHVESIVANVESFKQAEASDNPLPAFLERNR